MKPNTRQYAVVTGAYWAFTVTDGALRMLVLLHLHQMGRSPLEIASLFLLYEAFGVVTNFLGGWIGSRFGLKSTLVTGLALQIAALALLAVDPTRLTVPILLAAQALSGVAKDLTKMSSKSFVKLVLPEGDHGGLMRWVALLTGSKNTLKGAGFFIGGALLSTVGFRGACLTLGTLLVAALAIGGLCLPSTSGRSRKKVGIRGVFSRDPRLNWLAAARLFLFGSRDTWFVLALPLFLTTELGFGFDGVGAFLALWVIGYGIVQAMTPRLLRGTAPMDAGRLGQFTAMLLIPLVGIVSSLEGTSMAATTITIGLALFGAVFAVSSAIHSYLVVAYADADEVALRVGFYYTANALGRLIGTMLSGAIYQASSSATAGLTNCLAASIFLVTASAICCRPLRRAELNVEVARAG